MSLRKAAKANWHWDCRTCDYTSPRSPDRFGAELYGWDHEHSAEHVGNALVEAFVPIKDAVEVVADAFFEMGKTVVDNLMAAFAPLTEAFAQPQNVPHDPSLRGDKRKWGGK